MPQRLGNLWSTQNDNEITSSGNHLDLMKVETRIVIVLRIHPSPHPASSLSVCIQVDRFGAVDSTPIACGLPTSNQSVHASDYAEVVVRAFLQFLPSFRPSIPPFHDASRPSIVPFGTGRMAEGPKLAPEKKVSRRDGACAYVHSCSGVFTG